MPVDRVSTGVTLVPVDMVGTGVMLVPIDIVGTGVTLVAMDPVGTGVRLVPVAMVGTGVTLLPTGMVGTGVTVVPIDIVGTGVTQLPTGMVGTGVTPVLTAAVGTGVMLVPASRHDTDRLCLRDSNRDEAGRVLSSHTSGIIQDTAPRDGSDEGTGVAAAATADSTGSEPTASTWGEHCSGGAVPGDPAIPRVLRCGGVPTSLFSDRGWEATGLQERSGGATLHLRNGVS